jgi:hypothetical protein
MQVNTGQAVSITQDIYGDIYVMTYGHSAHGIQGGLYVLGQYKIDYTQPAGSHQRLNVSNEIDNQMGAILNIRNDRGTIGVANDQAGVIEFSSTDSIAGNHMYGQINVTAPSVTNTSERGEMALGVACSDDGGIDNIITITGGEKADYSTTEIAGDMKFNGNLTLDSTLVENGSILEQKASSYVDSCR